MSSSPPPALPGIPRRTLLAASAAGLAVLVAGCTSAPAAGPNAVTTKQEDEFAAQVPVQKALVAAYAAAGAADPALKAAVADLAAQAGEQLTALTAAAPGAAGSARLSSTTSSPAAPSSPAVGPDARAWLRGQVAATATSHATACLGQSGARAALLGSIAAGLRGQDGRLA
jgi:hypothetical protein